MVAKKKGTGGNLTRSQVVTVRLDPKLKFAAELAARKQRRTISSFIEWAVEQAIEQIVISKYDNHPDTTVSNVLDQVWDVEEADRVVKLATHYPQLLSYDEERLWKIICECGHFWRGGKKVLSGFTQVKDIIYYDRVRSQWEQLNKIIQGDLPLETLDDLPVDGPLYGNKEENNDDTEIPL